MTPLEGDVPGLAVRRRQCTAKPCGTSDRPRQESSFVRRPPRDPCEAGDVSPSVRSINAIACRAARRFSLVTNGSFGKNRAGGCLLTADEARRTAKCLGFICLDAKHPLAFPRGSTLRRVSNAPLLIRLCRALRQRRCAVTAARERELPSSARKRGHLAHSAAAACLVIWLIRRDACVTACVGPAATRPFSLRTSPASWVCSTNSSAA